MGRTSKGKGRLLLVSITVSKFVRVLESCIQVFTGVAGMDRQMDGARVRGLPNPAGWFIHSESLLSVEFPQSEEPRVRGEPILLPINRRCSFS